MSGVTLLLDGSRGIYIPQNFCRSFKPEAWGYPMFVERYGEAELEQVRELAAIEADEIGGMTERDREAYIESKVEALTASPEQRNPDEDWDACYCGPDSETYWESWDSVLANATYTDDEGNTWRLHQDGDLWCYCVDLMTNDEKENFGFEVEQAEDQE